ncbi:hypothetical protein JD974_01805 [Chromobacterium haemolyticum]|uniref:Preprotein translocase subunit SecA n=1 Tax=Chromobacterium haemolyticum TaxID=394935 RepID=A0ABS3GI11_9NEIS|nr:hypothetical protein [Chromobacterium haemolyticum]MBK0413130.1 hypothetical protein [Chromobacterium haemolyticum]MBO0414232.1 hypothetical protein [Chromobacterium haemolyticum]MBO0497492.1 hypothetical protein [Chromobacterium haemolyticum]
MVPEHEPIGVFDISDEEGVNDSERLLMRLCRRSFLSLWSYANLHTDQDMREGKGSSKEFADVLVVFGDDIIIFSDKHIQFQNGNNLEVAWARWYKRAILASAKQLYGAMSWLKRFPQRIFLDSKCTRPLPVSLPQPNQARFHLVAVTRGSLDACAQSFPGSIGTHIINTEIEGAAHEKSPFTVGVLDRTKHFIHVLDEFSLEVVMDEMNTITDFLNYLSGREKFLSTPGTVISSAGEEQLIAAYLSNCDEKGHSFLPSVDGEMPDYIWFDESHYPSLRARPEYMEMRRENAQSQVWDEIIERFIRRGNPSLVYPEFEQSNGDTEQALRLMAAESRLRRRILVQAIREVLVAANDTPGVRRARVVSTKQDPHLVYIFLVLPKKEHETYDEYRKHRLAVLHAYGRCAKLKFPFGTTFIALGFDHPVKSYSGSSEDLFVYMCNEWSATDQAEAEFYRRQLGILGDSLTTNWRHENEFPQRPRANGPSSDTVSHDKGLKRNSQKEKRKSKAAKKSKRSNRNK